MENLSASSSLRLKVLGAAVNERLRCRPEVEPVDRGGMSLYLVSEFLPEADCAGAIKLIEQNLQPSTVFEAHEARYHRTSETAQLNHGDSLAAGIDRAICDLAGLDPAFGEPLQGQKYSDGQHFGRHFDFFPRGFPVWEMGTTFGQRSWTAMIYLNNVQGGSTTFHRAGISVSPQAGTLLIWNNMDADGNPNLLSEHSGDVVTLGAKYIITKWFRESSTPVDRL